MISEFPVEGCEFPLACTFSFEVATVLKLKMKLHVAILKLCQGMSVDVLLSFFERSLGCG